MNLKFWKKKEKTKEKSKVREWTDAIIFAVIAATLIRFFIMEAFTIPTPSMEKSLLVGDFLFVSKFHYGARTPATPLQIPLTHQKIWFTNIPSYSDAIQLPQYRLPGFTSIKNNDVVVFNVPGRSENNFEERDTSKWIDYPVDLKTNYIKRCLAIPGDSLKIIDRQVYINGKKADNPDNMQYAYQVETSAPLSEQVLDNLEVAHAKGYTTRGNMSYYLFYLTEKEKKTLEAQNYVKSVKLYFQNEKGDASDDVYPQRPDLFPWNQDWYGPIWIPKEGATIPVNEKTLALYGKMIRLYDHNDQVRIEGNKLFIDGQELSEYTFHQDYYFMMGDNRHNSLDSRFWGFVPADHVVGKGFFIWLSLDPDKSFLSKIRWDRFFQLIE